MAQLSLSSFLEPEPIKVFDCTTCSRRQFFVEIVGKKKVKCGPTGIRDIPVNGCGSYDDGKDQMLYYPELPDNYELPLKYRMK